MQGKPYNRSHASFPHPMLRLSNSEYETANKHMKDRFVYALSKSLGCKITIKTLNNSKIEGILQSISDIHDSIPSLILKYPIQEDVVYNNETLSINYSIIQMFSCENVDFTPSVQPPKTASTSSFSSIKESTPTNDESKKGSFKTDTEISNINSSHERKLQKWSPDNAVDGDTIESLESVSSLSSTSSNWDQFKVNKDKFGIEAQFNEDEYTSELKKDHPEFNERMKFAEEMSNKILSESSNGNLHIAEERGQNVHVDNVDEEDKYSGVLRDNKESEFKLLNMLKSDSNSTKPKPVPELKSYASGQYIPPSQRAAQHYKDPAVLSSSAINTKFPAKSSISKITPAAASATSTTTTTTTAPVISTPVSTKLPEKPQVAKDETKKPTSDKNPSLNPASPNPGNNKTLSNVPSVIPSVVTTPSSSSSVQSSPMSSSVPMKLKTNTSNNNINTSTNNTIKTDKSPLVQSPRQYHSPQLHQPTHLHHQQIPQQYQQQPPQHFRNQQRNQFQPQQQIPQQHFQYNNNKNQYNNNQYANNQNFHNPNNSNPHHHQAPQQQQRHRKSQFILSNVSKDNNSKNSSILNGKFNILITAKLESDSKTEKDIPSSSSSSSSLSSIVPLIPPFASAVVWQELTSATESYTDRILKNIINPIQFQMNQQPVFITPINPINPYNQPIQIPMHMAPYTNYYPQQGQYNHPMYYQNHQYMNYQN